MNSNIATIISLTFLTTSFYLYRKTNASKFSTSIFFLMAFSSIVLFIIYGVANYFSGKGIDQATIYHLKYGLNGAGFLEYSLLIITTAIVLVLGIFFVIQFILKSKNNYGSHKMSGLSCYTLLSLSLLLNPSIINIYNLNVNTSSSSKQIEAETIKSFHKYYKKPHIESFKKNHKNIIYIYAESLERTYFDEALFPDLIHDLRELELKSTYFTNIKQVPRTGWTIAGMVASQCGIPLVTPSHGNSMSGIDQFLPSATCLGDLLNKKGYQLSYMGGSSLNFAGKGTFYKTHGFTSVSGRDALLTKLQDKEYKTGWGIYDDSLLDMAYNRFIKLSEGGGKFGLFTLTLDTHHPNGHPSKSCKGKEYKDASNPILNAVSCSDFLISDFIRKIINSPYADNTIVVLTSDHLAMKNTASDLLQTKDRRNLFMIFDPSESGSMEIKTLGSTLDIGATILPFLGYTGDIGLGRNLLNNKELVENRLFIHSSLQKWSQPIAAFWGFPKIKNSLAINVNKERVNIDLRNFKIPVLIELDKNLQSTLKFQFHNSPSHKTLIQHLESLERNKYFLLIDKCENANALDKSLGTKGFCLLAGQGNKYTKIMRLNENTTFTAKEIKQLLNLQNDFIAHRVAHAGGGINNQTYTNSLEALDSNIKNGFKYFEIDFSFTKDGKLVCLHDWGQSFQRSFGFKANGKITLKEFNYLVKNKSEFKKCTANSLANWMKKNPTARIISDIKESNIEALSILLETLPNAKNRIIPQAYYPENIKTISDMGFQNIIWTLYKFKGDNEKVIHWVGNIQPYISAITMPRSRATSDLPKKLKARKISSYVHTINKNKEASKYINELDVSEIYTDFLPPK